MQGGNAMDIFIIWAGKSVNDYTKKRIIVDRAQLF